MVIWGVRPSESEVRDFFLLLQVFLGADCASVAVYFRMPTVSKNPDFASIGPIGVRILHISVSSSDALFLPGKPPDDKKYRRNTRAICDNPQELLRNNRRSGQKNAAGKKPNALANVGRLSTRA